VKNSNTYLKSVL